MYRWCVEEQLSSYAIHRRLTLQGVPPRKSKHSRWAQSRVIEILRDSVYKGEGPTIAPRPGDVQRPYGQRGFKDPARAMAEPHAAAPERMDSGTCAGAD